MGATDGKLCQADWEPWTSMVSRVMCIGTVSTFSELIKKKSMVLCHFLKCNMRVFPGCRKLKVKMSSTCLMYLCWAIGQSLETRIFFFTMPCL